MKIIEHLLKESQPQAKFSFQVQNNDARDLILYEWKWLWFLFLINQQFWEWFPLLFIVVVL